MPRFLRSLGPCFRLRVSRSLSIRALWAGLCLLLMIVPSFAIAQAPPVPALLDNFDGLQPVLRHLPGNTRTQLLHHSVDRKHYRFGSGSERISIACPSGNSAHLGYQLPQAPVIKELRISAWVLSNRPGMQLAATVVLPRSIDATTGRPYQMLVRSGHLGKGGGWEQLSLGEMPTLVERSARVARLEYGSSLDEREAYVSQIVLLAPGGKGLTECLIDQIQIFGIVGSQGQQKQPLVNPRPDATPLQTDFKIPKVIQWQGEPFKLLNEIGFDAIGMKRLPSAEELNQAKTLGLAIVCPPPTPRELSKLGIPEELADIYAWDLGEQLSSDDLDHIIRWQELVKRFDPIESRPTLIAPRLFTREASRLANVLVIGRPMLGTDLTLQEHAAWLNHQNRLARPGTAIWTTLDTQLSPTQALQAAKLQLPSYLVSDATYQQLTALSSAAFAVKSHGFYYASNTSLAASDIDTQRRAKAIQLNNIRLKLAEPWLASGKVLEVARSSKPELTALVMKAERSHLLVPMRWANSMRLSSSSGEKGPISFTLPGVGESSEAYLLTLGGTQRIRHKRVTGGVKVTMESLPSDAFVLLTDDPKAFSQVARYIRKVAPQATKLRRTLVSLHLQDTAKQLGVSNSLAQSLQQQATLQLEACDRYLASGSLDLAYSSADTVDRLLNQLDGTFASSAKNTSSSEGVLAKNTQHHLQQKLARTPVGNNLLSGGEFESLEALLNAGWRHRQLSLEGIKSSVRLSSVAPHSGSFCLELEAKPSAEASSAPMVPASPVWISTAPVQVQEGDLVEITGMARVPEPLLGSIDGLQLIDSIGGPDMATRIAHAPSWQQFRIIRAASADGQITVSIALSGLGRAQIDDLAIRTAKSGALPSRNQASAQGVQNR